MKKYVFISYDVFGIGGTQIYVRNKLLYVQSLGYTTYYFSTNKNGEIVVKDLEPYKDTVIPELLASIYAVSNKKRNEILDYMIGVIGASADDEVIIESGYYQGSLWGEELAKRIGAKHFINFIIEDYSLKDKRYLDFYAFKFDRGELAGNTPYALTELFKGYKTIENPNDSYLNAVCSNVIEDVSHQITNKIGNADFVIGSVGRVNKPFVYKMVEDVVEYTKNYLDKTFELVLFGGSPDASDYERLNGIVKDISNLKLYITGPIYPVPIKALKKVNVFIASAGAARTSADAGFLTVAIDSNDFLPIGIVGKTTNNIIHRAPEEKIVPLKNILDDILFSKLYDSGKYEIEMSSTEYLKEFDKHTEFLSKSSKEKVYYDMKKFKSGLLKRIRNKIRRLIKR